MGSWIGTSDEGCSSMDCSPFLTGPPGPVPGSWSPTTPPPAPLFPSPHDHVSPVCMQQQQQQVQQHLHQEQEQPPKVASSSSSSSSSSSASTEEASSHSKEVEGPPLVPYQHKLSSTGISRRALLWSNMHTGSQSSLPSQTAIAASDACPSCPLTPAARGFLRTPEPVLREQSSFGSSSSSARVSREFEHLDVTSSERERKGRERERERVYR